MQIWIPIVVGVACLLLGALIWVPFGIHYRKSVAEKEITSAEDEAKRIINDSIKAAESKKRVGAVEAKEQIPNARNVFEAEGNELRANVQKQEHRLQQKEENLDRKLEGLEKKEETLRQTQEKAETLRQEIEQLKDEQVKELERISGLTCEDAKAFLIQQLESEVTHESAMKLKELEENL